MRFIHVDEGGTSSNEKYAVVAGVVSHADAQWVDLNKRLKEIADDMVPPEDREGIVFHAKDIWHGNKKFHREKWPKSKRFRLLRTLAKLPMEFALPVVIGAVEKDNHELPGITKPSEQQANYYSLAFSLCVVHSEYVLREMCGPREVGTVIAEDVPEMRRHARFGYKIISNPDHEWPETEGVKNYMPLERVVEVPLFAEKADSSILQIADLIAFLSARILNGRDDARCLFDIFAPQVVALPPCVGALCGTSPAHK